MISSNGWLDWAIRMPSTNNRVNPGVNSAKGVFMHSAEGYASVLLDPRSEYGFNGNHSWHLTNTFDGTVYQHYPFTARCHHATAANNEYIGVENEGDYPKEESLTMEQIISARRFIKEISEWRGWTPSRGGVAQTLWEHNEVTWLGGSATACPSGRIPWQYILAPEPEEDIAMSNPVWATWRDKPENVTFRTWELYATSTGLKSRFVPNFEQHQALEKSGVVGPLLSLDIETLRQFHCEPDPAS